MTDLAQLWASVPQSNSVMTSGDGQWLFWTWSGLTETDEVYATRTDGSTLPERLTHGTDHYILRAVSDDGSRLILAQSPNASEHDHLLLLDRSDSSLRQLTPTQDTHYVFGGIFTKDEQAIIFTANFDYDANAPTEGGWIWLQDLQTGTRRCLAKSDTPFEVGPKLSPSGKQLLWHRHERKAGATQLWALSIDGANCREVLCLGDTSNAKANWLDDDTLAVVADQDGKDGLAILTLSTGKLTWIEREPELLPFDTVKGVNGSFACIAHDQFTNRAVTVSADHRLNPLPNASGRRSLVPLESLPDGSWIAEAYDADAPHQLVRIMPNGQAKPLVTATANTQRNFKRPRDFRWSSDDGLACQGWLYEPPGNSKGLIVWVHGGPTWHSEDWVNPRIGFWVQSGFTVLDPNYRGSTGNGYDYREMIKQDGWGGREQDDIRAGIEALIKDGLAQKGRIAVAGNSYGGFSSWVAITRFADLVTAAIPMCGMYRLDIDYHETEMPHGRAYSIEMMGGTPEEFPEKYARASPGRFIDQIKGHLLIVHGMADSNVGPENSLTAVRELTAAGIPHEVMLFENEGHGVARTSNLATYLARTAEFLERAFDQRA